MRRLASLTLLLLGLLLLTMLMANMSHAADSASGHWIKGKDLRALFLEKTVIGEYNEPGGGIKNDKFSEYHHPDGTSTYTELGQPDEKGLWTIVGEDKICYRYPGNKVFNKTYCFFVFKREDCYYNYSPGAMSLKGPRNKDWWTSRFVIKGEGGSCEAPIG